MSLQIGRAGVDVDLLSPFRWNPSGDIVDFDVSVAPDAVGAEPGEDLAAVLVQQLAGLVGSPDERVVPVVWDAWPAVDGFYEVRDLDVKMMGPSLANGLWKVGGSLRRVSSFGSPLVESHLLHGLRDSSAVAAGTATGLVGVPGSSTVYRRGTTGLGSLSTRTCDGGTVLVDTWLSNAAQANAEWQVAPADFYEGACQISDLTAGVSSPHAILGRQVPGGLDPNEGWSIGNRLVSVLPSEAFGGTAGTISVLSWAGAAYESSTEITPAVANTSGLFTSFSGVSILRNSPEACTIRLLGKYGGTAPTLDLTIRRGDRNVQGVLRVPEATDLYVSGPLSTTTAITGAARLTSNDADGNRFVFSSALGTITAGGAAPIIDRTSATVLDFGFGHEIGGSGSSGIDTAQALANQYAAVVGETCEIVEP